MRLKSAVFAGCATFLTVSVCYASGVNSKPVSDTVALQFSVAADQDIQDVRPWLNKIKPAAGDVSTKASSHERKHYWQQTVNRKRHNTIQE